MEANYDDLYFSNAESKLTNEQGKILALETELEEVIRVLWKVSPEHRDWIKANWKNIAEKIENND